ncbi:MAG: ABC transporter permease, partial [Sphingobacterium sp.]
IFQFATSIILIIGTLVINQQIKYILNRDLGFNKEQVLILRGTGTLDGKQRLLKNELKELSSVASVSIGDYLPVTMDGVKRNGNSFWNDGRQNQDVGVAGQNWIVDDDYISTFGIKILEGRNFNMNMPTDSAAIIVNQKMVKELNIKNPIGAKIRNYASYTIIAVVEDFIFGNMRNEDVKPLALVIGGSPNMMSIRLKSDKMEQSIQEITNVWNKFSPNQKIQYTFLDDGFAMLYADVQRTQVIVSTFAGLAIFIACLGLFGLAAFVTQQRTKEIGIRKVLGASLLGIIKLLSADFIKLIFIAILIACPIGWWAMDTWLQDFNYRISIQAWIFILAGIASMLIAFGTIFYHALKIGRINPVNSLKDE